MLDNPRKCLFIKALILVYYRALKLSKERIELRTIL